MKKYLNQIDKIEQSLGIDDTNQNWMVNKLDDDVIKVTKITAGNTPQDSQHLTANEYDAFKKTVNDKQLIEVEWV